MKSEARARQTKSRADQETTNHIIDKKTRRKKERADPRMHVLTTTFLSSRAEAFVDQSRSPLRPRPNLHAKLGGQAEDGVLEFDVGHAPLREAELARGEHAGHQQPE